MMRLPRPAGPRILWRDLRSFFAQRSPHQWIAGALALAIPAAIGTAFFFDTVDAHQVGAQIIYVDSWPANRSIAQIVAKQEADERLRQQYEAERRRQFQRLEDGLTNMGL